ncbi:protein kinase family protein [Angustibacter sp. McL0619]|uniref:protein kinase family protein n=1 Tax=Angustibacter sp. McL0619 TaxID=3415676 RepID=UPI003CF2B210
MLKRRLEDADDTSTWQAHDDTLDRLVHLRVVAEGHPHAEAVLDAARQAAAVEDVRLVRILDVGEDEGTTYVVSEWLRSPSLEEQLEDGPLAPATARTVVGETALALEAARHRGLHHLRLTPARVHLLDDGTVKVTELATAAALDGVEAADSDSAGGEATHKDARDLIALAYAALTATWPLRSGSTLPHAPRVAGKPVAPAQIVTGVPADLDTLCAQTFAGAGAPDTPGDLAGQIAPWGRQRNEERAGGVFPHALPPTPRGKLPTAPPPAESVARPAAAAPLVPPLVPPTPASPVVAASPPPTAAQPTAARPPAAPPAVLESFGLSYDAPEPHPHEVDHEKKRQTGAILALMGGFIVVFLLLAYCGLRGLGDHSFIPSKQSSGSAATESATPSPTSPTEGSTPSTPTGGSGPFPVVAAGGFDPQGDGSEKDSIAGQAVDGKASTSWTSDTYKSAAFGGLKKGVGLQLDLGGEKDVSQVRVALGADGGSLELHTMDGDQLGKLIASAPDASGTVTLKPTSPVRTASLVVWFTSLPPADGGYRAVVNEVTVE